MNEADVIVVGAGFSGLAAARFLAESGVSVIVLEARFVLKTKKKNNMNERMKNNDSKKKTK